MQSMGSLSETISHTRSPNQSCRACRRKGAGTPARPGLLQHDQLLLRQAHEGALEALRRRAHALPLSARALLQRRGSQQTITKMFLYPELMRGVFFGNLTGSRPKYAFLHAAHA